MKFVPESRNFRKGVQAGVLILLLGCWALPAGGADPDPSLASLMTRHNRETLVSVKAYIDSHPEAGDLDAAYRWIFETARREGWEADVLPWVERYLMRDERDLSTRALATQVSALGWARQGKHEQAIAAFDDAIDAVGLRAATETLDFASRLATALQVGGAGNSASDVYSRLSRKFLLNPSVRQFSENRMGKLELFGKSVPDSGVQDLEGKRVDWKDYRGKLVLVDFWATNCPPCLEEFPTLKQLHADFQKEGFEVVGVSLDENKAIVEAFQEKARLPWRLALSSSDRDATRERFKVVTIPSMFLVDGEGKVVAVDVRGEELRRVVSQRLNRVK